MRKPRDIDAELKALADKAKQLKERRVQQLGELVIATGADTQDAETLAVRSLSSRKQLTTSARRRGATDPVRLHSPMFQIDSLERKVALARPPEPQMANTWLNQASLLNIHTTK